MKTAIVIPMMMVLLFAMTRPCNAQQSGQDVPNQEDAPKSNNDSDGNLRRVATGAGERGLDLDIHINEEAIESSIRLAMEELQNMELHLEHMSDELKHIQIDIPEFDFDTEPMEIEIPSFDVHMDPIEIEFPEFHFEGMKDESSFDWQSGNPDYTDEEKSEYAEESGKDKAKEKLKVKDKTKGLKKL